MEPSLHHFHASVLTFESVNHSSYFELPLRAHSLLHRVRLYTLGRLELEGGPPGLKLAAVCDTIGFNGEASMNPGFVTATLFRLRGAIGRLLRWDPPVQSFKGESFIDCLNPADRARSAIAPGTPAGISQILYQYDEEMLGEIINRTVHCFWVFASRRSATGYTLWFAVYVRRRNWFTPVYMALISPLLKWIIYPSMMRAGAARWRRRWLSSIGAPP